VAFEKGQPVKPYLFINPKAGLLKGCRTPDEVKEQLRDLNNEPDITIGRTSAAIEKFITKVKKDKPEYVYVAGGDGTIATIMKGLMNENIIFGIIPTGSMNNIGQSLGIGDDIESAVQTINRGRVTPMDLGKINGDIFLESIGIGLVAQVMYRIGEQDSKKEVLRTIRHTIAEMATAEPIELKMKTNNSALDLETTWLTVTNTGRAAAAVVDPSSSVQDKVFEIVYCEPITASEMSRYVIAYLRNSHIREEKFHRIKATHVEIYLPEHVQVHVDGVLREWRRLKIDVLPAAIKVLT
jgi:YegS/Rv2252/BmrU family lipid kinase